MESYFLFAGDFHSFLHEAPKESHDNGHNIHNIRDVNNYPLPLNASIVESLKSDKKD